MRKNLTQMIEEHLINMLTHSLDNSLEIRRIELAQELGCAPSQITYVLGTRFTDGRGFSVESRRGNGGFVRITRRELGSSNQKFNIIQRSSLIDENLTFDEIKELPLTLWKIGITTRKESELLDTMMEVLQKWLPSPDRNQAAKELLRIATKSTK